MHLDLFNNLIKSKKENKTVQNFIKELGEALDKNVVDKEKNKESFIKQILEGERLTTQYRDKIKLERHEIINKYSKEHSEKGEFYYVYNKRSDNTYGLFSHKNGETGSNIVIKENQLPKGTGEDCVLIIRNGKYILDKKATQDIQQELTEMIKRVLKEQQAMLKAQRAEGSIYSFVDKVGDMVELINETNYTGECFEEIDFPKELSSKASEGDRFQYKDGKYQVI